jgi:hypothetical protein
VEALAARSAIHAGVFTVHGPQNKLTMSGFATFKNVAAPQCSDGWRINSQSLDERKINYRELSDTPHANWMDFAKLC